MQAWRPATEANDDPPHDKAQESLWPIQTVGWPVSTTDCPISTVGGWAEGCIFKKIVTPHPSPPGPRRFELTL
jgi:hypothetical protein